MYVLNKRPKNYIIFIMNMLIIYYYDGCPYVAFPLFYEESKVQLIYDRRETHLKKQSQLPLFINL